MYIHNYCFGFIDQLKLYQVATLREWVIEKSDYNEISVLEFKLDFGLNIGFAVT